MDNDLLNNITFIHEQISDISKESRHFSIAEFRKIIIRINYLFSNKKDKAQALRQSIFEIISKTVKTTIAGEYWENSGYPVIDFADHSGLGILEYYNKWKIERNYAYKDLEKFLQYYLLIKQLKYQVKFLENQPLETKYRDLFYLPEHSDKLKEILKTHVFIEDDLFVGREGNQNELSTIFSVLCEMHIINEDKGTKRGQLIAFFNEFGKKIADIKSPDIYTTIRNASKPSRNHELITKLLFIFEPLKRELEKVHYK